MDVYYKVSDYKCINTPYTANLEITGKTHFIHDSGYYLLRENGVCTGKMLPIGTPIKYSN